MAAFLDQAGGLWMRGAFTSTATQYGGQGQRQPSAIELEGARHQGELIAKTANKLFG
jgi:NAD(P)H dehydrogenase (quinone)